VSVLRTRAGIVALAAFGALAIAIALVLATQLGKENSRETVAPIGGATEVAALLDGIPQRGNALGNPNAPVTLVEYADLQCPYCAQWATTAFPALVSDYVRTGKVRLVFRGMAFIGPDSERALRTVLAAGERNRMWHVLDLLYVNQGAENSGWADDDLLRSLTAAVPGLDAEAVLAGRYSAAVESTLGDHQRLAAESAIDSTPAFELGRTGSTLERFRPATLDVEAMRPALERLLAE
jgi:protein-disulfide isomerase